MISACWIAKNEAGVLARSILSVKDAVDELIVVDTGSTDDTVQIARDLGARVERFEWIGDFSAARNFALSKVNGEFTFFLDADEYFENPITRADSEWMADNFRRNPQMGRGLIFIENVSSEGKSMGGGGYNDRFLRMSPQLGYLRRIHEMYRKLDGGDNPGITFTQYKILHSGYSAEKILGKAERNFQFLKDLEKDEEGKEATKETVLNTLYRIREAQLLSKIDLAAEYLRKFLHFSPEVISESVKTFNLMGNFLQEALLVAARRRDVVSERQVRELFVTLIERWLAVHCMAPAARLYIDALFNPHDDRIIKHIARAKERASRLDAGGDGYPGNANAALYGAAADAFYLHGRVDEAMGYAMDCMREMISGYPPALHMVLIMVKGQPAEDIVILLSSVMNLTNSAQRDYLLQNLMVDGYQDIFLYVLKKKLQEQEVLGMDEFTLSRLLIGQYASCARDLMQELREENEAAVRRMLLLTVLCAGDEARAIFDEHRENLAAHARVAEAFLDGRTLAMNEGDELATLGTLYPLVAFAAGMETAERYLRVFGSGYAATLYRIKADYCLQAGCYEQLLAQSMEGIPEDDLECYEKYARACVHTRRYRQAYDCIVGYLAQGVVLKSFLQLLYAIAKCCEEPFAKEAGRLYETYTALFDEAIERWDVVRTEVVFDDVPEDEKKRLSTITPEDYDEMIRLAEREPNAPNLLDASWEAAPIYLEKGMPNMAERCLRRVVAKGRHAREGFDHLASLFEGFGNVAVAESLRLRRGACED